MTGQNEALDEIVTLARRHKITTADIARAMEQPQEQVLERNLSKLFSYIGGILVFCGLCLFIVIQWDGMNSPARVVVTLGSGFAFFIMALVSSRDERHARATTPLLLIAAILQPLGLGVLLREYSADGDILHGMLFITLTMLVQQACALVWLKRTTLAFTTLLFGLMFFDTIFAIVGFDSSLRATVLGASALLLAHAASQSPYTAIAPFWMFTGSVLALFGLFDLLHKSFAEVLFPGICAALIFASTTIRSRTLLACSTLGLIGYISWFTAQNFSDTIGWPLSLIVIGMALMGLGAMAVRLNNKYIKT